jgi:hypothetical protein
MKKTAFVILILLLGCASATGGDVKFSTLARGDTAPGITNRINEAITDPISFEQLWNGMYRGMEPVPDMPKVDFAEDMVIAVSPGLMVTGGYDAEIIKVQDKKNRLNVTILMTRPSGTVTEALTQPYHIIKLKKSTARIVYTWIDR